MRTTLAALTLIALAAVGACGAGPTAPAPPSQQPAALPPLRIATDPVVDMTRGEARALPIEERDAAGTLVTRPATAYAWISSAPSIVSVDATGTIRAIADYGGARITAQAPDGKSTSVDVWVQLPAGEPSTYRITFVFSENIPRSWHQDFEAAARRWEKVIRAALPPVTLTGPELASCGPPFPGQPAIPESTGVETGTRIYVARHTLATPATGQICMERPGPFRTSVIGRINIGADGGPDPLRLPSHLAPHEIGHVLGLVGVSRAPKPWFFDPMAERYTGPFALEGYRRQFGTSETFLSADGAHWKFGGDLMSMVSPANTITKASIGALMDLGYPAAWYGGG